MPESCNPKNCPVNERVDRLEKEFDLYRGNSRETHTEIFKRVNALEQSNATMDAKIDTISDKLDVMDGKLDTLDEHKQAQDEKPRKFLDHLREKAVEYIMLAMLGALLLKIGIGG